MAGQAAIERHGRAAQAVADHAGTEPRPVADEASPEVADWRERSASLTPAEVALDERARERWLPRLERIERGRVDPTLPAAERQAYAEIAAHLQRAGVTTAPAVVQFAP